MKHTKINTSDIPIRLFKSDFLEFFSHISPVAVLIIWTPVALYFLIRAILNVSGSWVFIPICFLIGIFLWTISEYLLHRFMFHFSPKAPWQERVIFLFHGVHHEQPQCKTRLVMPPVVSIPMALIFFGLFTLIIGKLIGQPAWVGPTFSGFIIGYLTYDMIHYASHHFPMRKGYWKFIKRYHIQHHYKTPDKRFGVSSPLWDMVFGTKPD